MIKISCEGDTSLEVLSHLKGFVSLISANVPTNTGTMPEDIVAKAVPAPSPAPAFVPAPAAAAPIPAPPVTPVPAPVCTAPAPVPGTAYPTPPAAPAPTSAPAYALDQITRAGADLITAKPDLMGALMAMLPKYGVQTLAALKPDQFGAVATELRALGAKI